MIKMTNPQVIETLLSTANQIAQLVKAPNTWELIDGWCLSVSIKSSGDRHRLIYRDDGTFDHIGWTTEWSGNYTNHTNARDAQMRFVIKLKAELEDPEMTDDSNEPDDKGYCILCQSKGKITHLLKEGAVQIVDFVTNDTLEPKLLDLLEEKRGAMKELLEQFRHKVVSQAFQELTDSKARLSACEQTTDLEVAFRDIEYWASRQKRLAQKVRRLNNRGADADVKLRKIVGDQ